MLHHPLLQIVAILTVAVLIRMVKPRLWSAALLAAAIIASTGFLGMRHGDEVLLLVYRGRDQVLTLAGRPPAWPPEKHRSYPDLELVDQDGNLTRLSDFKGRVILVEPVGIPSPACVAFTGGHDVGAFAGVQPQSGLDNIESYARDYGGISLDDPRIVRVQLLIFNHGMAAPEPQEAFAWAEHFGLRRSENEIVLAGSPTLVSKESRAMIPGFQLIDKHFILRADSTGNDPQDNLYDKLLPMMRRLVDES